MMNTDILQRLEDIGYDMSLMSAEQMAEALESGPRSTVFTNLIVWLTNELAMFGGLDERVQATETAEDASSFLLELSLFLKELGCKNRRLMTGNVNGRLSSKEDCILLVDFLTTELMAIKILEARKPKQANELELTLDESGTAKCLKDMLEVLKFPKPPDNISAEWLFKKLEDKLRDIVAKAPPQLVGKPLFNGELSPAQWVKLEKLQDDMTVEYRMRREMLLKRLDVTVQSFLWSDRIKPKEDQLNRLYHDKRNVMSGQPNVTLAHLLAARDDLAIIEKTSNATVRKNTRSGVNNVIIGAVPDRGGRPQEQQPPPPEMPSWQKDRATDGSFRGGRGGRGGGGGGGRGMGGAAGGFRDNKDASNNFGQNRLEPQRDYQRRDQIRGYQGGNPSGEYQVGNRSAGYQGGNVSGEYQSGNRGVQYQAKNQEVLYQSRNQNQYQAQNQGVQYQAKSQDVPYQAYQAGNRSGEYQGGLRSSDYQAGNRSNDYQSANRGGGYQGGNRSGEYQRGGGGGAASGIGGQTGRGTGGRVQGGWNQQRDRGGQYY